MIKLKSTSPVRGDSRLSGVIWDMLRMQVKAAVTAGVAVSLLILALHSFSSPQNSPATGIYGRLAGMGADPGGLLLMTVLFMLIFLISGWFYAYRYGITIKKTIAHFIHQLKQFQRGVLSGKVAVSQNGELKKLAGEINELTAGFEQQIISMRRLLNENAKLIDEAEKGAGLEERRKLARDLHDAVSQELFAISMSLGAVPKVLHKEPGKAEQLFRQIEKMVHHAQQELRALIMHLRPVTLEGKTLNQALAALMEELSCKHPAMAFKCDVPRLPEMEKGTEEHIFRVIQEGLSNVLRHADAEQVKLSGRLRDNLVLLKLEDDGKGFNPEKITEEKTGSYGLALMKERMVELGGHFTIISFPDKGTVLEFRLPATGHSKGES